VSSNVVKDHRHRVSLAMVAPANKLPKLLSLANPIKIQEVEVHLSQNNKLNKLKVRSTIPHQKL